MDMPERVKLPKRRNRRSRRLITIAIVIVVVVLGWTWWTKVFNSPSNVFNEMLERSLSSSSVVRHVRQAGENGQQDEYTQLIFGAQNLVHVKSTTSQLNQAGQTTKVVTESIGTPTDDYARYVSITSNQPAINGKKPDYSSIENVWGKAESVPGQTKGQYFNQAVFGIMPFGNLGPRERETLLNQIRKTGVYTTNYGQAKKQKDHGRSQYVYDVKIKPQAYVSMLQTFSKLTGMGDASGLDPAGYADAQAITLQFTVDVLSRQLVRITYPGETANQHLEEYSGYGGLYNVQIPSKTISFTELQNRTQQLLQ